MDKNDNTDYSHTGPAFFGEIDHVINFSRAVSVERRSDVTKKKKPYVPLDGLVTALEQTKEAGYGIACGRVKVFPKTIVLEGMGNVKCEMEYHAPNRDPGKEPEYSTGGRVPSTMRLSEIAGDGTYGKHWRLKELKY